jgi:hypothetical protein
MQDAVGVPGLVHRGLTLRMYTSPFMHTRVSFLAPQSAFVLQRMMTVVVVVDDVVVDVEDVVDVLGGTVVVD